MDFQRYDFRCAIAVKLYDAALQFSISLVGSLDDHQRFTVVCDPALPTIYRLDLADDVDAGSKPLRYERIGDARGFVVAGSCDEDD
jgi:hypothetical protein